VKPEEIAQSLRNEALRRIEKAADENLIELDCRDWS
jgi:hypothetical protein